MSKAKWKLKGVKIVKGEKVYVLKGSKETTSLKEAIALVGDF
jgi:hypothetical protein